MWEVKLVLSCAAVLQSTSFNYMLCSQLDLDNKPTFLYIPAGDLKPLKEKECLEVNSQKSLKEGQSLAHLLLGGRRMQKSWAHSVHRHV